MLRIKCRSTFSNNVSCITKHEKTFFLSSTSPRSFNLNPNVSPSLPLKFSYDIMEFTLFTNHRKLIFFLYQTKHTTFIYKLSTETATAKVQRSKQKTGPYCNPNYQILEKEEGSYALTCTQCRHGYFIRDEGDESQKSMYFIC